MSELEQPRIGIIGAGALGSYFGIRLAASGCPVDFLLRSDYQAVRDSGMSLRLEDGEVIRIHPSGIYREAVEMEFQDWVIIGLKTTRNGLLKELLRPLVREGTLLITIQNGLGNVETLQALYPANPVVGVLCQIGVNREAPGCIRNFIPGDGFVQIGFHDSGSGQAGGVHLDACQQVFEAGGIRTKRTVSLGEALWRKLMWNVPFNGLTVIIGGKGTDAVCADPALRARARALMEEIRLAATAQGYGIEAGYSDQLLGFTDKLGVYFSSTVLDWKAGRRLEVEAIFRRPLKAGQAAGVAMPELDRLVTQLDAAETGKA